jgi:hypothetical protein
VPAAFVGAAEPDPEVWAALAVEELEVDEFEEFEELDDELLCGAAGAAFPPPEPVAGDASALVCRMAEKLCDGAFVNFELAGGAELGAIIVSRIASVMNRAART